MIQRLLSAVRGRVFAVGNRTVVIYGNFTGTLNMGDQIDESRKQLERERLLEKVERLAAEPLQDQARGLPIHPRLQYCAAGLVAGSPEASNGGGELPADVTITQVFEQQEEKLLVLGEDGSGKTRALRELTLSLVEAARNDIRLPVPLILNLASWGRKHERLVDWLVDELSQTGAYDQNRDRAGAWVTQELFLPLLLGLDEVDSEKRADCVRAINEFHMARKWVREMAVACRTDDYEAVLPTRLDLRGAVMLCPLTRQQIEEYLADRQLAVLRDAIAADSILREMAESPLTLGFMVAEYEDGGELTLLQAGSADERRARLAEAYVESRLKAADADARYPAARVRNWLGWIARNLQAHGERSFYLDRLQPTWLPTAAALRWYVVVDRLGTALLVACLFGLLFGLHFAVSSLPELTWIGALVGALVGGLLGGQADPAMGTKRGPGAVLWGAATAVVAVGTTTALVAALAGRLNLVGLALVVGALVSALAGFLAGGPGLRPRFIALLGPLGWSPALAVRHAVGGLVIGGVLGGLLGVAGVLTGTIRFQGGQEADLFMSASIAVGLTALLFGLVLALGFGLAGGLIAGLVEKESVPNQAVRRSVRRAALVFGWGGGLAGLLFFVLLVLIGGSPRPADNVPFAAQAALLIGPIVGVVAALAFGGYACLSHLALRLVLWRSGVVPFDCVRLMEHAKRCELVSRVGGGYEFRPGLLEYFGKVSR